MELAKISNKKWTFIYKGEVFVIEQNNLLKYSIHNSYLPKLVTIGTLNSVVFFIKRMMKNKECLSIMSLAKGGINFLGLPKLTANNLFLCKFDSAYKKTKAYKNYKLTK